MKLIKKFSYLMILFALVFSISSCGDDEEPTNPPVDDPKTIVDLALETDDLSSLVAALEKADLVNTLNGNGEFTVFAPTNDAFAAFLSANGFASLDDVPTSTLTQVLLNHVVSGTKKSTDLSTGYEATLATREDAPINMYINTASGVTINNMSNVTAADVEGSNGVVHIVDAVIGLPNIVTFATADNTFSSLVAALTRGDLGPDYVSILSDDTVPYTVFAPTNAAFDALIASLGFSSLADVPADVLTVVLNYHVVPGANVRSADLVDGQSVETFQGENITIDLNGGAGIIDATGMKTNIVSVDVQATNGVIHAIDKVILPQEALDIINPTIAGVVVRDPNFSNLRDALIKAELVDVLNGDTEFTVFAPTNDAFAAFLSANGFASLDEVPTDVLTQVLLNHVVTGVAQSGDLTTGYIKTNAQESTTENFIDMYVDLSNGVTLNGQSNVTAADVSARNGVIHVVDAVIGLPSVVTFATTNEAFTTLVAALTRGDHSTDFVAALSATGPFTVFAPTNDAFGALLQELGANELGDIDINTLDAVLKYHVVAGANVLSTMLTDDMDVATLGGANFRIDLDNGPEIIDNNDRRSSIMVTDVQAANGVIHVIDTVILP